MARETRDVFHEALQLPLNERAKLAGDLLESLDRIDADVEVAWADEIQRRLNAIRDGDVGSTDWRDVLDEVEKEVLSR
jgi:putative addiction module component (TIGR02574 family)